VFDRIVQVRTRQRVLTVRVPAVHRHLHRSSSGDDTNPAAVVTTENQTLQSQRPESEQPVSQPSSALAAEPSRPSVTFKDDGGLIVNYDDARSDDSTPEIPHEGVIIVHPQRSGQELPSSLELNSPGKPPEFQFGDALIAAQREAQIRSQSGLEGGWGFYGFRERSA